MPGMLLSPEHGVLPLDQSLCTCKKATFDSWGALLLRETSHDLFLLAAGAEVFYHQGKVSVEWKLVTYRSEGLSYQCRRRNVTAGSGKLSADSESNRTGVDDSKACCRSERSQGGVIYPPSTPPLTAHTAYALPLAATVRKWTTQERDQLLFQCLYTQQQQCNNSERALHSDRSLDRTTSLHYNFQKIFPQTQAK